MKRFVSTFMVFCLLFCLCGCAELDKLREVELPPLPTVEPSPETVNKAEETPLPTPLPEVSEPQILVNIGTTNLEAYDPAEEKELILSYSYDTPQIYMDGRPEVSFAINKAIALLDETHYTGNDHGLGSGTGGYNRMLEMALDHYGYVTGTGAEGYSLECTASRTVSLERADGNILSIVYHDYYYTGGAHGNSYTRAYGFDTRSGEMLSIEDLSSEPDVFRSFLIESMVQMAREDPLIREQIDGSLLPAENYAEAFEALLRDGSWYLDHEGLKIYSDVYEFGSYAAGEIVFAFSYEQLKGQIDERWMPAARQGEASFSLRYLNQLEQAAYEIVDRVVMDEEGEEICLLLSGTAYDVKLSTVDYTDAFYETAQIWYANQLQDCAVQLVTTVPEGMPNRMLSYRTADGQLHRLLISQSGQDGRLLLIEDNIEAIG